MLYGVLHVGRTIWQGKGYKGVVVVGVGAVILFLVNLLGFRLGTMAFIDGIIIGLCIGEIQMMMYGGRKTESEMVRQQVQQYPLQYAGGARRTPPPWEWR